MLEELRTENARISSVSLGIERGFSITFWVTLEGDGWGQSLGGFHLGSVDKGGFAPGLVAIAHILETVGVEKWEDLPGKYVRAKVGCPGSSLAPIIGNVIKDKWFDLHRFMKETKETANG